MRVFLPSTLGVLPHLPDAAERAIAPGEAFAATSALREEVGQDEEELEYAALQAAADASLELISADPAAPRRRVVLAAEVAESEVGPGDPGADQAAVRLTAGVAWSKVAAVHVDAPEAEPDVAAALEGDPRAADAHELLWYATQEVPYILDEDRPQQ
jgi:hypothetical protein